jgi:hypothetical protein
MFASFFIFVIFILGFYSSRFAVSIIRNNLCSFISSDLFFAASLFISLPHPTFYITRSKYVMCTNSTYVSLFFIHFMFVSCVFLIISAKIHALGLIPVAPTHCQVLHLITLIDAHAHSLRLPWTRDRPVAEASASTAHNINNRKTSMPPAGFEPHIPTKRSDLRLRPRLATRIVHLVRLCKYRSFVFLLGPWRLVYVHSLNSTLLVVVDMHSVTA